MKKSYLMTPGPVMVPPEVREAEAKVIIHHRTPQFSQIFKEVIEGLRYVCQTKDSDIYIFASSGTGAMEAAVVNLASEGERVLVIDGGKFGERWLKLCRIYRLNVARLGVEWGKAPSPDEVEKLLDKEKGIKILFTTLSETSTATVYPIEDIARICKEHDVLLVVDAISGLLADRFYQDNWQVDVVVGGSQKGLMAPPGLSFCSVSKKAQEVAQNSNLPKFYFSFQETKKALQENQTPFTPAVSLFCALAASLRLIKEQGIENIYKKYQKFGEATREAIKKIGLKLFSFSPSNAVTGVWMPNEIKAKNLINMMEDIWGIKVAEGQDGLKDKIFRIAHIGYVNEFDILATLSAVEMSLYKLGFKFELGIGVAEAHRILFKEGEKSNSM